ncbi:MAG: histidine decarboxylase [Verrucomicrobia subdivision 3 bacterium]|nr:histidine decarboxylase [Limisphaerales bacterium]
MPGTLSPEDVARLDAFHAMIHEQTQVFAGYPVTANFNYHDLFRFLDYPLNNIGDPFDPCTYHLHSREFEREVLDWFAELQAAPKGDWWGYVTNGGTEGNLYGLYLARELYPNGMVYFSQDTHYSVSKNLRLLRMPHIMIKSQPSGAMDLEDLEESLRIHRDVPPIIFANIGTTMREGVDDIPAIQGMIKNLAIPESYIHADAALCGMTLPFIDGAPEFNFSSGIHSMSISGHKLIGSPLPCGVVLALKLHVDRIARSIEYVGTLDTTITGSRNAITPLMLWYAIRQRDKEGFRAVVAECLAGAEYAVEQLNAIGVKAWRNPHAITVVLPKPSGLVLDKWQLAVQGEIAHIMVMPHVDRDRIDRLVSDITANPV